MSLTQAFATIVPTILNRREHDGRGESLSTGKQTAMGAASHQTLDGMSKASKIYFLKGMQMDEVAAYLSNQNQKREHADTAMPNTTPTSSGPH